MLPVAMERRYLGHFLKSEAICHKMVTKGFVTFEKIGTSRIYQFTKEPVHKSRFEQIYHEMRTKYNGYHHKKVEQSSSISEELAVKTLQAAGYKLQKCVGFDLEKFKSEQPGMYWRYMQYKDVL